jgi:hypothetical protein
MVSFFNETSDDFFRFDADRALDAGVDLAFIDGLHLFENSLRDFMNVERHAGPATVVVIDDVLPNHPVQALRERQSFVWCGDVWKLADCLERYRPELHLLLLDTDPSGLLLVAGLDQSNRVLWDGYDDILDSYLSNRHAQPPEHVLARSHAIDPAQPALTSLLRSVRESRAAGLDVLGMRRALMWGPDHEHEGLSLADPPRRIGVRPEQ